MMCSTCKLDLDTSCFYPNKRKKRGFDYKCKYCVSKINASKSFSPRIDGAQTCSRCGIEKDFDQFEACKRRPNGRDSHCKKCRLIYKMNRYRTNINHKMKENIRRRVRAALVGANKSAATFELIGCDILTLKNHLESRFIDGMSWDNYGCYWHIDHIKPCASFDMSNPEQQKVCFNYANLQPLLAKDNLIKGKKTNE